MAKRSFLPSALEPPQLGDALRQRQQQVAAGVPPDLIRLSVGLETLDDILWDIDQALGKA